MGFNILICDDSALARKMARSNLPDGFAETIYEVSNGMDALEVLAHHTIDLVLPSARNVCYRRVWRYSANDARKSNVFRCTGLYRKADKTGRANVSFAALRFYSSRYLQTSDCSLRF